MAGKKIDGVRERGVRRAVLGVVHGGRGERRGRQRCWWPYRRRCQPKPGAQPPHMHIKPTLPRMRQEDLKPIIFVAESKIIISRILR